MTSWSHDLGDREEVHDDRVAERVGDGGAGFAAVDQARPGVRRGAAGTRVRARVRCGQQLGAGRHGLQRTARPARPLRPSRRGTRRKLACSWAPAFPRPACRRTDVCRTRRGPWPLRRRTGRGSTRRHSPGCPSPGSREQVDELADAADVQARPGVALRTMQRRLGLSTSMRSIALSMSLPISGCLAR